MFGTATFTNARNGGQPRSLAASSSDGSSSANRDCITTAAKHMVKVAWASVTVTGPRSMPNVTNISSIDTPMTTSGITIGATSMPLKT
ncbi:hypothetical protein D3C71_2074690 [compost metagenome]